uniref:Zinc transporter ZIP9 n=1 Tax=Caenorhabditis tropicalis TaxID=1561998 RepID=A0A1I7U290_9PELO
MWTLFEEKISTIQSRIRLVSIFGAGLLVGTALSVIIPEGVEALYGAQCAGGHHHSHENPVVSQVGAIVNPAEAKQILENSAKDKEDNLPRIIPKDAVLNEAIQRVVRSPEIINRTKRDVLIETHSTNEENEKEEHGHSHGNVHSQIGYSLVLGFVLMLLVDQIGSATVARNDRSGRSRIGISATIGLVVHAAADGVALGSASVINKSDVQLIVFVAIMLHKAPAAFGLVSFLLMESIDRRAIRKHLVVFSAAAPVAAIVTFIIIMHMGESMRSESSTGVLMLFSAGTFLYVATVHVLPELANNKQTEYSLVVDATSPSSIGHSHSAGPSYTLKELLLIIAGAVVPAILASGHSH